MADIAIFRARTKPATTIALADILAVTQRFAAKSLVADPRRRARTVVAVGTVFENIRVAGAVSASGLFRDFTTPTAIHTFADANAVPLCIAAIRIQIADTLFAGATTAPGFNGAHTTRTINTQEVRTHSLAIAALSPAAITAALLAGTFRSATLTGKTDVIGGLASTFPFASIRSAVPFRTIRFAGGLAPHRQSEGTFCA